MRLEMGLKMMDIIILKNEPSSKICNWKVRIHQKWHREDLQIKITGMEVKMKIYHHSGKKTLRENLDKASFPIFLLKYPWHFLSKGKKSTLTPKMFDKNFEHFSYFAEKN